MDFKQTVAKGVFWSTAQAWGARLVSFAVFVLLSRLLTPEDFGLVAMAMVYLSLVQIFQDQGFGDAIIQHPDIEIAHLNTAFWSNLVMGGVLTVVSYFGAGLVADVFHEPRLEQIVQWFSIVFVLQGLSVTQQAILKRHLAFKALALRTLLASILGGVVGITAALMNFGVWSLVAQTITVAVVDAVILWQVSDWRPGFQFSYRHFKELFFFGINIVGIAFLNFLNRYTDDFLIGVYLGPVMLGYYTVAYRLFVIMTDLMTNVINVVAFPVFSRLQQDVEKMRSGYYMAIRYTSLISFPAFMGIAVLASEITLTLFGTQWAPSIPVMRVLSFIGILHSILFFNNSVVIAAGKPTWRLGMAVINATSNVIAFWIAVRWGIVAVAAAYVIRGYLLYPLEVWMMRTVLNIKIKEYFSQFWIPAVSSLGMAIIVIGMKYLLPEAVNQYLRLAILVFAGAITYLAAVRVLMPSIQPQLVSMIRLLLPEKR